MLEGADATLNFAALWNIAQQVITFQKLDGTVLSAGYTGEGTVKGIGETPYLKLVLKLKIFLWRIFSSACQPKCLDARWSKSLGQG